MNTIAVIGAGTMGNGIAHTFAQSGFTVKLIDISDKSLEKGMATIAANLDRMVTKGTITEDDKIKTIGNIITYTDIKDGVVGCDLVVEAATENVTLKMNIFKQLSDVCEHNVILASNTSSIAKSNRARRFSATTRCLSKAATFCGRAIRSAPHAPKPHRRAPWPRHWRE